MGEPYERLCWIYITVKITLVYDHVGNTCHLSDLTELSEGRITYLEQFANKPDYEQKSLLQDLRMKDDLYSRTNWIKQGEESLLQIVLIFEKNPSRKLSRVSTTQMRSSRICPNKILVSTVKT
jgi:hypothetical protein